MKTIVITLPAHNYYEKIGSLGISIAAGVTSNVLNTMAKLSFFFFFLVSLCILQGHILSGPPRNALVITHTQYGQLKVIGNSLTLEKSSLTVCAVPL